MGKILTKQVWTKFTETFGTSIIHPQSTVIKFQKEVITEAKKYAKGQLIDIGCGRMPYRRVLEPLVDSYIGVDHPKISKLYKSGVKPEVLADAKSLPFGNNTFDTALLIQVLEHVDSPEEVIKEAARILKPNGILIISVPFFYPLHDMPYDWGRYTSSALKSFIDKASLRLLKIEQQGSFIEFFPQILNTFLIKRINDIISTKFNLYSVILLTVLVPFSIFVIIFNNLLIIFVKALSQLLPKYPNYFPLEYLIVARKKS